MSLKRFLLVRLGRLLTYPVRKQLRQFEIACETPEAVQNALLFDILRKQADTQFGRDHKFGAITSVAEYRNNVPVAPYEYVSPYIEKVQTGDTRALLADPRVLMFALTSGTTASRKLIPVTDSYLAAYRRGWNMWGVKMYRDNRGRRIAMRPIVQLGGDPEEFRTPSGIPCGNLSGYTAMVQRRLIKWMYTVPHVTGKIKDAKARYYVALRFSIGRNVSQLMAANPSTLVQLARALDAEKESLLRDLHDGTLRADLDISPEVRDYLTPRAKKNPVRADELSAIAGKLGRLYPMDVWPTDATVINTWTGGSMGPYLRQLPQYYGEPPVHDLGLLASEGRFTIPLSGGTASGVLDIWSHYFEFIPEGEIDSPRPTVLGAHELREGGSYFILPTTSYGLYRYHISDLVRVTGFQGKTPLVEFLGKGHRFANLTGEKLSEYHVTKAMDAVAQRINQPITAYSVSPVWDDKQPYYAIFLEEPDVANEPALKHFLAEFDKQLGVENMEYAAKRESGRLGSLRAMVIAAGTWAKWDRDRLSQTGGSPEQYKHPCLIGDLKFRETMAVLREVV
ncbi:GH3 auxin-responsive promoter-binding protein OS=Singulisphaera acidiphila (strain ATCC BAA-1392 / DSM 18658 / VKM B-2454 / MOB10) GN=Sinac_6215 PE=4 SV=1: GH3 [Gemmata massiliana]|uniref:GH3 auxin-responsive promoter n=1 Tax=Gemmata massiliana TaxID=1210884 RepID=A0A6P2DPM9_9BACT|nr:GH3 auxin-responsive promoter family protein [Gemmata massiliana]VTS03349.1 GH3 auxin-responsive promoter-binding protein OS=Singulisphaera acidiphila (strain ATCC BAA-1392 / DSM 18658 / VKM B-2454 / MOB10) GN=Sinac_6215 PE=4 SV=1: GH3 [Gemmata massiliana]